MDAAQKKTVIEAHFDYSWIYIDMAKYLAIIYQCE